MFVYNKTVKRDTTALGSLPRLCSNLRITKSPNGAEPSNQETNIP